MSNARTISLEGLQMPTLLPEGRPNVSSVLALLGWNEKTSQLEIVLTKRAEFVETHKGQISFPGGYWEADDANLLQTALREAEEEIGLSARDVRVRGSLEPVTTRGSILIHPWVGEITLPYPFALNKSEVDRLIYLPVEKLKNEGLKMVMVDVGPIQIESPGIWVENELIWGATARVLGQLVNFLPTK